MGNTAVNVIAEDRDGNLWIGSGNKGVWVWPLDAPPSSLRSAEGRLQGKNVQRSTLTPHITCFYHDRNNTMWVGSAKFGAAFTDLNSPRFTHVSTRIIKMKRGKSLLEQGKTNISEVADMVGYSPKQFARYFKMMYGVTPSEYLKTQRLNI